VAAQTCASPPFQLCLAAPRQPAVQDQCLGLTSLLVNMVQWPTDPTIFIQTCESSPPSGIPALEGTSSAQYFLCLRTPHLRLYFRLARSIWGLTYPQPDPTFTNAFMQLHGGEDASLSLFSYFSCRTNPMAAGQVEAAWQLQLSNGGAAVAPPPPDSECSRCWEVIARSKEPGMEKVA
jgi:hypothetical protein